MFSTGLDLHDRPRYHEVVGTFSVDIEIGDAQGIRFETVNALVDTGASFNWVPRELLQRLGVPVQARWEFEIAGGQIIERDVAETIVRYDGEARTTIVVFGDEGSSRCWEPTRWKGCA